MEAIGAELPASDGIACFNRMYLEVTSQVNAELDNGFYADRTFMTRLDVNFANLYFDAVELAGDPEAVPLAWRPLVERRAEPGIEEIQFALAGMNAHINRDLPLAIVTSCHALAFAAPPAAGSAERADYSRVNDVLARVEAALRDDYFRGLFGLHPGTGGGG